MAFGWDDVAAAWGVINPTQLPIWIGKQGYDLYMTNKRSREKTEELKREREAQLAGEARNRALAKERMATSGRRAGFGSFFTGLFGLGGSRAGGAGQVSSTGTPVPSNLSRGTLFGN